MTQSEQPGALTLFQETPDWFPDWAAEKRRRFMGGIQKGRNAVGMFDKDKEIGLQLTDFMEKGEQFVLHGATVDPDRIDTGTGLPPARKTRLIVSKLDEPNVRTEVSTLGSAIADKADEAEPEDFPCVVYWTTVESNFGNDATVVQFVRDYAGAAV